VRFGSKKVRGAHALVPFGVKVNHAPVSPVDVLEMIRKS
jgi:chloramphenicol O-acetyltransferase